MKSVSMTPGWVLFPFTSGSNDRFVRHNFFDFGVSDNKNCLESNGLNSGFGIEFDKKTLF